MANEEMNLAWQFVEGTNVGIFLTGKAGTGKTTFLRTLKTRSPKRMVIVAPTGVAAINAEGVTIHSFFQLPLSPYVPGHTREESNKAYRFSKEKKDIIRSMDLLVIDEISMVRCDVLDAIDNVMRKYRDHNRPFGGVQLLMIGDLQQLSPVAKESDWDILGNYYASPYFFSSKALQQTPYITIELQHIYRQSDNRFISLLAKVREGRIDDDVITTLNTCYNPQLNNSDKSAEWIRLTTHNFMAQQYNDAKLNALKTTEHHFQAQIKGNFPESSYPADYDLVLKVGAQVMFIKNDHSPQHLYYNGKIGTVTEITKDCICVKCQDSPYPITVEQDEWENTKYTIDEGSKEIKEEVEGVFKQYPLRLAWAITIHKSQGLTFDHAEIDINDSFAHGQVYVALSRCRTLEGIRLSRPLSLTSIITDVNVKQFIDNKLQEAPQTESKLPQMRLDFFKSLLDELFGFNSLFYAFQYLTRVVDEHLYKKHAELLKALQLNQEELKAKIVDVANKFQLQYTTLIYQSSDYAKDEHLQDRITKGCEYFNTTLHTMFNALTDKLVITIENKAIKEQYTHALDAFVQIQKEKQALTKHFSDNTFSTTSYLRTKAKLTLEEKKPTTAKKARKRKKQ